MIVFFRNNRRWRWCTIRVICLLNQLDLGCQVQIAELRKRFWTRLRSVVHLIGVEEQEEWTAFVLLDEHVIEPEELLEADYRLAKYGFNGVKSVHCEDEAEMRPELWDSSKPWTHDDARPERAETAP